MLEKRELERKILGGIDRLVHILIDISCTMGRQKEYLMEQAVQMVRDLSPLLLNLLGGQEEHLEGLLRQLVSQKLPPSLSLVSFGPLQEDLEHILAVAFFKEPDGSESPSILAQEPEATEQLKEQPGEQPEEQVAEEIITGEDTVEDIVEDTAEKSADEPAPISDSLGADSPETDSLETEPITETDPDPLPDLSPLLKRLFPKATILPGCYYRSLFLDYYLPEQKMALCIMQPGRRIVPSLEKILKKEGLNLIKVQTSEINTPLLLAQRLKLKST